MSDKVMTDKTPTAQDLGNLNRFGHFLRAIGAVGWDRRGDWVHRWWHPANWLIFAVAVVLFGGREFAATAIKVWREMFKPWLR